MVHNRGISDRHRSLKCYNHFTPTEAKLWKAFKDITRRATSRGTQLNRKCYSGCKSLNQSC
ncbi:hypothetical protein H6F61_28430 [Cyanobacteria bacterium FACHB-472]|nr:hypothetical protein [Cyanobacteria bacterium FACHB-472]